MNRTPRLAPLGVLLATALGLATLATVPASADHAPPPGPVVSGSGNMEGTEVVEEQEFTGSVCFRATNHIFALAGVGTYGGRTDSGQEVVYKGEFSAGQTLYPDAPIRLEIQNTETYYHGPLGTHGTTDATCAPATAGTPAPAEFRLFVPDHLYRLGDSGEQLPCLGQGRFARGEVNNSTFANSRWWAEWTLAEDCTVVGNQAGTPGTGVAKAGTAMTHHGSHDPCYNRPCVDNFKVDYKQYVPVSGPYLALHGPATAQTGENVTVTARFTNSGVPVANAPLTFSATGPAPGVPPGATAVTGADGGASFTFTAAEPGDYTVSASTTYNAQVVSATHQVTFEPPAPLSVALAGPAEAQTEEDIRLTATVTDGGDPAAGADVRFSVAGPGERTPATGSATADTDGRAIFAFRADRAGDYTVTATATRLGEEASAAHTVRLEVNTFFLAGSIPSEPGTTGAAVIDPAGDYAYFAGTKVVEKVDARTFQRVGVMSLSGAWSSGAMDPAGRYAYFGEYSKVAKIDLASFQLVGTLTLNAGETSLGAAVVDPAGRYAYFGTQTSPARIIKVDLATFQRVGAIVLPAGENEIGAAVIDPAGDYAYFGLSSGSGGVVVQVDLRTFERVGGATVTEPYLHVLASAVIDADGRFAYFGTGVASPEARSSPGKVVKVDLARLQPVGALTLEGPERHLTAAVIDSADEFAYFGANPEQNGAEPPIVVKIDLKNFNRVHGVSFPLDERGKLLSAVIHPSGDAAYVKKADASGLFGWQPQAYPAKVFKLALTRPPSAAIRAADDSYSTPYNTTLNVPAPGVLLNDHDSDNDPLTAHNASDPPRGSVVLARDGSFTYTPDAGFSGTDTFTYVASDAMDYSAPATVTVAVGAPPEGVASVTGSAYGYHSMVSLFGGPSEPRGPAPTVALAANASNSPQHARVETAEAVYGPATMFKSGPIEVHAEAALGPAGYATTSSAVQGHADPAERPGPFLYDGVHATCSANGTGTPASTTITNGVVETSYHVRDDPNTPEVEQGGDVKTTEAVPTNPPPGYVVEGTLDHIGDRFRIVFNEQAANTDGSRTLTAAHMYLLGPTAVGDLFIAQAVCGVELSPGTNRAPDAVDDAYVTDEDTATTVMDPGVVGNDVDPDGDTLTATVATGPAHGSLVLNGDGSFTYTPYADSHGADAFTYTVSDGRGGSDTATVALTVKPVNDAPVGSDDAYATARRTTLSVAAPGVLANDADADGDALTAAVATGPASGKVSLNPDGSFTYTPARNFTGTDTFTYTVSDAAGATDTATVTIAVGGSSPPPSSAADLSVSMSDSPDPAKVESEITYTVVVANGGPDPATGVSVSFSAKETAYVSSSGATCSVGKGKDSGVRCEVGDLASGATRTLTIVVQAPTRTTTVSATATVSATSSDPDTSDNTITESTTVRR